MNENDENKPPAFSTQITFRFESRLVISLVAAPMSQIFEGIGSYRFLKYVCAVLITSKKCDVVYEGMALRNNRGLSSDRLYSADFKLRACIL